MLIKYASNSRYSLSSDGKEAERKQSPTAITYTTYVSKQGDTLDKLAQRLLNDFTRYWEIADINPQIKFPNEVPVGTVLRIPR